MTAYRSTALFLCCAKYKSMLYLTRSQKSSSHRFILFDVHRTKISNLNPNVGRRSEKKRCWCLPTRPVAATRRRVTNTNRGRGGRERIDRDDVLQMGPDTASWGQLRLGSGHLRSCIFTLVQSLKWRLFWRAKLERDKGIKRTHRGSRLRHGQAMPYQNAKKYTSRSLRAQAKASSSPSQRKPSQNQAKRRGQTEEPERLQMVLVLSAL
ncbi:hypothetical protein EDB89DRAFT_1934767 [Lactarius sanguifluus]|nr:hypothetical protein EDB89DRAFT_1934767 [Lactarius sanguifluus]